MNIFIFLWVASLFIVVFISKKVQKYIDSRIDIEIEQWTNKHIEPKEEWSFISNRFNKVN